MKHAANGRARISGIRLSACRLITSELWISTSLYNLSRLLSQSYWSPFLLLQVRGSGTTLFGQAESSYRSRRGVERLMFRSTIVLAGLFVVIAIVNVRLG